MMKVVLCCMPFGPPDWPSLALGLLKSGLEREGIACDARYFSIDFASRLGKEFYIQIAEEGMSYKAMAGEWVFAQSLFDSENSEEYFEYARHLAPNTFNESFRSKLRDAQSEVEPFLAQCLDGTDWGKYDLIGFSSNLQQQNASLALARRIKARWPHKRIIFGGNNLEGEMGVELLRVFDFVDFVCLGEGDRLLPALAVALHEGRPLEPIDGLAYRQGKQVVVNDGRWGCVERLDELPYPNYDDFFEQFSDSGLEGEWRGILPMESSRGCWWGEHQHCAFCGTAENLLPYRRKAPERVLDEMEHLAVTYESPVLFFTDKLAPRSLKAMLPALAERKPHFSLFYDLRTTVEKAQLVQMKRAGIEHLMLGVESLSTPVLKLMHKGTDELTNLQTLKWCRELGINAYWNILLGFPGEEPSEYERMAEIIPALTHLKPPVACGYIFLLRFSPHFCSPAAYGLEDLRPSGAYRYVYPGIPEEALGNLARQFDFDYQDGRRPRDYGEAVSRAVDKWREAAKAAILAHVDDGERLRIFDTRPGIESHTTTILSGLQRELYLLCDKKQSLKRLSLLFPQEAAAGSLQANLERFVSQRLMVSADGYYLSLAVDIGRYIKPERRGVISDERSLYLARKLMGIHPALEVDHEGHAVQDAVLS